MELNIKENLKKERVKLTDARALLLYVLFDLVANGEFASEFSSEKICYFLQKFGAEKYFKLDFSPNYYGPYSGKVRFILNTLNGSYVMGYSDMNKKPFEPLTLVADAYDQIKQYVEKAPELSKIAQKTITFLNGYYSDFALELLSSVDFLITQNKILTEKQVIQKLEEWSDRKRSLFSNPRYIRMSLAHIQNFKAG